MRKRGTHQRKKSARGIQNTKPPVHRQRAIDSAGKNLSQGGKRPSRILSPEEGEKAVTSAEAGRLSKNEAGEKRKPPNHEDVEGKRRKEVAEKN